MSSRIGKRNSVQLFQRRFANTESHRRNPKGHHKLGFQMIEIQSDGFERSTESIFPCRSSSKVQMRWILAAVNLMCLIWAACLQNHELMLRP